MRLRHAQRRLEKIEEGLRWLYRARIFVDRQVEWEKDEMRGSYSILSQLIVRMERERHAIGGADLSGGA
jgi:hypothetical protein